jgi:sodium/proline symporter
VVTFTFVVYILAMLGIGVWGYCRTRNLSDYILGGRSLNSFVAALSAGASDMSGWLLLGLPGYAYVAGLEAVWIAVGLAVGTYLNWLFVARRLRERTYQAGDALTLSEYLENRFQDRTRLLRVVSGTFILVFFLFYTTSGLVAGGKLFESVFGLPYFAAVLVGAAVIIVYTFLGGFLAVCWTDCIQGLLMVLALVLIPIVALQTQGGWGAAVEAVRATNPELLDLMTSAEGAPLGVLAILSLLGWGLGYFGQPHILARFMAIGDPSKVPAARRVAMTWVIVGLGGALLAGFAGIGTVTPPLEGADTEKVFIVLVQSLLHPVPAGICLAAILAAIMSTADSQLLVSSSVLAEDFYKAFFRRAARPPELVWAGRVAVILLAVIASLLALDRESMVLDLVAYAWAGFGAAFGPTLILSLYWPRMTRWGAFAGIAGGGLTVILWKPLEGGVFDLYEIIPGFLVSALAIWRVSLLTAPPETEPAEIPRSS